MNSLVLNGTAVTLGQEQHLRDKVKIGTTVGWTIAIRAERTFILQINK
ncbi:hypothetical protein MUK70_08380 [Dyadobacter chenwenxiniae]|uniref:Uncharacterized protein n=1 Tax=Dyadobacter chenwenxiniae TaxID=2906456 RepID=A0A9X1PLY1_9BACT|nr:hypothetical protein [Dyadobacter chenwenxiniae]MCF0052114.1 hypothetical protein [Dyadobacter chenwenxiniae]MCF0062825.1 hypothetical protein [Dyadobacter chenwenxiniae]UON85000.1 hypothetical protein MUK70_08380 [Dyadobacter chenwenxiniae]